MCGIAGIISPDPGLVNRDQLKRMTDAIAHRGPEGDASWFNTSNTVALGHRRLSIIDLSEAAAQPMHYQGRYTIVFNGEIYNYIELRNELEQRGDTFQSHSDTEVILAAYARWKKHCVDHFDGMFAFAIWDEEEKTLFAARDRFGEKPFFYAHDRERSAIWFASEIKGLVAAGFEKVPDEKMMLLFLTNGFVENTADSTATFYKNIHQLPPATSILFKVAGPHIHSTSEQYWCINKDKQAAIADEDALETFTQLFTASVEKRFRSDVPVGTSLSGGIDSSSIAAIAGHIATDTNSYKCFSAVFPGFQKDESRFSQMVAQRFGLSQFVVSPGAADLASDLQKFLHHQDEPVGSASVYAQYKVYQLAKQQGVTVLLDGQGADELLAGYSKYLHWYLQELVSKKPGSLAAAMKALRKSGTKYNWGWKNYMAAFFPTETAARLKQRVVSRIGSNTDITTDFKMSFTDNSLIHKPVVTKLNDILHFNTFRSGLQELLRYADRNSMAHSCEVRLPFLAHGLAEFCFKLPSNYKIRDGYTKWVLRKSMHMQLPREIVWRTDKVGFEPPQEQWMADKRIQDMIMSAKHNLVKARILNSAVMDKKIQPQDSLAADNVDWWYLSAGSI